MNTITAPEYADLKDHLNEISIGLGQVKEQNRVVMDLLKGNPLDRKAKGMIGELHDLTSDVDFLKSERKRLKWTVAGAMAAGGVFFSILAFIFKHLFKL